MTITAREPAQKHFAPCPEGLHTAVCVDVVDLGVQQSQWGEKHKVRVVWQIDATNAETGRRFNVMSHYTLSLHKKAKLRQHLETWRGKKFTEEQLQGFDLEKLLTANCQIQVSHNIKDDGEVWANVQAIVPAPTQGTPLVPLDYVRVKDRPTDQGNGNGAGREPGEDDVPF